MTWKSPSAADSTWAAIHTGDLALQFSSAANWQVLNRHTQTFLAEATRQLSAKRLENDTLRHLLPELVLDLQAGRDNPVIKYLAFKGTDLAGIDLHLRTNATEGLHGYARLGTIATSSLQLDTVYSVISHDSVGINFHTTFHNYKRSNPHRFTAVMDAGQRTKNSCPTFSSRDMEARNVSSFSAASSSSVGAGSGSGRGSSAMGGSGSGWGSSALGAPQAARETSQQRFEDAKTLLNYGFSTYALADVTPAERQIVPVKLGRAPSVEAVLEAGKLLVGKGQAGSLSQTVTLREDLVAPVEKGQTVGTLTVQCGDATLAELPLTAADTVERMTWGDLFVRLLRCAVFG